MRPVGVAAFALLVLLAGACSYDWSPAAAVDAGLDAGIDADASQETDAPPEGPAGDAGDEPSGGDDAAPRDASDATSDAPDCAALEAQVAQARAAAIACQSNTSACMTTVTDECGCTVVVYLQNTATDDYKAAIAALQASCTPQCPGCVGPVMKGLCIAADGGGALACYQ